MAFSLSFSIKSIGLELQQDGSDQLTRQQFSFQRSLETLSFAGEESVTKKEEKEREDLATEESNLIKLKVNKRGNRKRRR
jgi:hypothetical protein